ncbi:hypothetical protein MKW92_050344 [Papaver armeniacum]|nr:hypothetical protein MKW92_050344 [Papaver armeniacum]
MDSFNNHSKEMVVIPIEQMSDDNQQLTSLKTKDAKKSRECKGHNWGVEKQGRDGSTRTMFQGSDRDDLVEKEKVFQEEQAECRKKQLSFVVSGNSKDLEVRNQEFEKSSPSQKA